MPATVLVGAQWGDEGKGKIIDALAPQIDLVARFQGGPNAGHTVIVGSEKIVLHQVPTGILHAGIDCAITPGVLLDPWELSDELKMLAATGRDLSGLLISPSCHVIMPWHRALDKAREADLARRLGKEAAIGTTGRGIGPCAMDKAGRHGIRLGDLLDTGRMRTRITEEVDRVNRQLELLGAEPVELEPLFPFCEHVADELRPWVRDTRSRLYEILSSGGRLLMEGAQGAMLDIDWGTYPFVTSTSPIAAGACIGAGIPMREVDQVIGIFKAYATRVGNGPFPSEFPAGDFADEFRLKAGEFGATTGRPRRCGWFDLVAARYACQINGFTDLVITKLDVLDGMDEIQAATAYQLKSGTQESMPEDLRLLEDLEGCEHASFKGWRDTGTARSWQELPAETLAYLAWLEKQLDTCISWVSNGPERSQLLAREGA